MLQFEDRLFRPGSSFELVPLERLSPGERDRLTGIHGADRLYGVLRPAEGSLGEWRSASPDTALLLLSLKEPGPIPAYLRAQLGADLPTVLSKLVLDRVLEVDQDGSFVTGAEALHLVLPAAREPERGRTAMLSIEALQYGAALKGLTAGELASRLYFYGRKPVTRSWQRRLANEEAVQKYLRQDAGGAAERVLRTSWTEAPALDERPYWRIWRSLRRSFGAKEGGYKLYVSVDADSLPDAFLTVASLLAGVRGVLGFKVGRTVFGLFRPDNLVVYVSRLEDLREAASMLEASLSGCKPQGVPFTAEVTRDGMMSWGIDPPTERGLSGSSWRLWLVERLAEYLLAARAADAFRPWQFALDRLSVDGIDAATWVPSRGIHSLANA